MNVRTIYRSAGRNLCFRRSFSLYHTVIIGIFLLRCQATPSNTALKSEEATKKTANDPPLVPTSALRSIAEPSQTSTTASRFVIHNKFVTRQYVFLDDQPKGVVGSDRELAFDITPGTHIILVSDSPDGKNNPQHIAETYDAGFEYRYEVVAR